LAFFIGAKNFEKEKKRCGLIPVPFYIIYNKIKSKENNFRGGIVPLYDEM